MANGGLRDLAPRLRAILNQGVTLDMALDELRRETSNPLEALKALRVVTGLDAEAAVRALEERPSWRDSVAQMQDDTRAFFEQE